LCGVSELIALALASEGNDSSERLRSPTRSKPSCLVDETVRTDPPPTHPSPTLLIVLLEPAGCLLRSGFKRPERAVRPASSPSNRRTTPSLRSASRVREGRIHPDYRLGGAASGRMSCSSPNLQQLPREAGARRCVRAPDGYRLVVADYGQIELRILGHLAGEDRMLEAFRDGLDIHVRTAARITGKDAQAVTPSERQRAKAANFGLAYGQSAEGFASTSAASYGLVLSLEEAGRLRASWFSAYPMIAVWQDRRLREAKRKPVVRTVSGRWRDLRRRHKGQRPDAPGKIPLNFPIQGAAAEGLLSAMAKLPAALADLDAAPIITVHDEIVLEAREDCAEEAARRLEAVMREGMLEVLPGLPSRGLVEARVVRDWSEKP
jgi:DNA polymerase I